LFGVATLTLTVTDTNHASSSRSFALTVNPVNDRPVISELADQSVNAGTNGLTLSFTVADVETPPASLTVSGVSANPTLVPAGNLVFGGSGGSRTVTVTPMAGQGGTALITITVRDAGGLAASTDFVLTVNALNSPPTIA